MIIWIIGLSGAGKTTIGKEVYAQWKLKGRQALFLDGDAFREIMGGDLGHDIENRRMNAGRICRLCKLFDQQNIDVICCILSIFEESREWNRQNLNEYIEVFIDVPMDELVRRDSKGLYRQAIAGKTKNVVGVDLLFEKPKAPNLIIENYGENTSIKKFAQKIIEFAETRRKDDG